MGSVGLDASGSEIDWGMASAPFPGEQVSGDMYLVQAFRRGTLVAVVDGLGHGPEAAVVAERAIATLADHPDEPITSLLRRCDDALRGTRGTVMSLASFDAEARQMTWLGLGNVEGIFVRAQPDGSTQHQALALRGGVVGSKYSPVQAVALPLQPGNTLILATDGIQPGFTEGIRLSLAPQALADGILARHAKGTDDALVLVARYLGEAV